MRSRPSHFRPGVLASARGVRRGLQTAQANRPTDLLNTAGLEDFHPSLTDPSRAGTARDDDSAERAYKLEGTALAAAPASAGQGQIAGVRFHQRKNASWKSLPCFKTAG